MLKSFFMLLMLGLLMCSTTEAALTPFVADKGIFSEGILRVIGIADVFGDGEKVSTAIVQYPKEINPKSVSPDDFFVEGRTIESVFVNIEPKPTKKSVIGEYVILHFKQENTANDGELTPRGARSDRSDRLDQTVRSDQSDRADRSEQKKGEPPMRFERKMPELKFAVQQIGTVTAADDTVYFPSTDAVESSSVSCPIIDKFKQFEYVSPSGAKMPYNIYLPRSYSTAKKFPMLVFIPDASVNGDEVTAPLFQGNGATIFASDSEKRKNECIVLAPQYTSALVDQLGMMTTDRHVWTPGLELVSELIFSIAQKYSVDPDRIYGAGQSQGCMANIAISDRYPGFFAAQMLVAGQWDVDEMEALKDKKLWIVTCEGDTKAFPGMNAAVDRWKALGAKVAVGEEFLNAKAPRAELFARLKELDARGADINYSVFAGGNHMYTWSFAYDLEPIRDWLFRQ